MITASFCLLNYLTIFILHDIFRISTEKILEITFLVLILENDIFNKKNIFNDFSNFET